MADIILDRLAEGTRALDRLADGPRGSEPGTWMRSVEVAQYLGWSRKSVYRRVARMAMPHYKVDGILLFKRNEVDAWLEHYREESSGLETVRPPTGAGTGSRAGRPPTVARQPVTADVDMHELPEKSKSRPPRALPPPLGGDEQHKDEWARQLEFTRRELDEMSPSEFGKAWDTRNERLREGGVFEYVTELTDAHGWKVIEKMTASELVSAVAGLGLTPSAADAKLADERE